MYREKLLEEQLQALAESLEGVRGAVIVSVEGFVVATYAAANGGSDPLSDNASQVAAMAAALLALGEQTLIRLGEGHLSRLLVEGEAGALIVYPIAGGAALAVLAAKEAKMGLVLHTVARTAAALADVLNPGG